jgi:hypothetical protein
VSNDHLDAHFRVIFDRLTASHRAALEELRDGNAALARAAAKGKLQPTGLRMPPKPRSYDSTCEELAEAFLADHQPFTHAEKEDLAQTIQNAIEDWFFFRDNPARGEDAE